jgi:hypothetical protein
VLSQCVATLRVRPHQLSFRTISCFASDTRSINKTFSRIGNSASTAMGSSFEYFLSAGATQMV